MTDDPKYSALSAQQAAGEAVAMQCPECGMGRPGHKWDCPRAPVLTLGPRTADDAAPQPEAPANQAKRMDDLMWDTFREAEAPAEVQQGVASYRHKKRGTIYEVVGEATLQCAANPALDEQPLVIYRGEDGMLWARGVTEFHDGRFEALATPQQGQEVEAEVVATCERLAARMGGRYVLRANDASDPQSAAAPADRDILHLARILEEWDMKPWPNDHTGHSYEDIARDALTRLALPAAASVEAGERAQIVAWLRGEHLGVLCELKSGPFWDAADAIERGEHLAAKGKDQA